MLTKELPLVDHCQDIIFDQAFGPRKGLPLGVDIASESPDKLPLEGLRVLDLGTFWAAPYAAMYLATLGADVIKIEAPMRPDSFRFVATSLEMGERWYECGPLFQATNLGKQGMTLDLSRPEGQEVFRTLVAESDVVIENFTPRVMENGALTTRGSGRSAPISFTSARPASA